MTCILVTRFWTTPEVRTCMATRALTLGVRWVEEDMPRVGGIMKMWVDKQLSEAAISMTISEHMSGHVLCRP